MVSLSDVVLLDGGDSLREIINGLLDGKRVGVCGRTWSGEDGADESEVSVVGLFDETEDFISGDRGGEVAAPDLSDSSRGGRVGDEFG